MTSLVRYLTHPQVHIDPSVPVPSWGLNDVGRARVSALIEAGWLSGTTEIVSSGERKAVETAQPIAAAFGVKLEVREAMHENDRSATGFLEASDFERVADEFFAHPALSVRGWERAVDAQERILREAESILARASDGDVLFVGHGAVGTLLFCHYSNLSISRVHDQPDGGGCYFSLVKDERRVLHPWRRMEDPPSE
ncbi:MAG: phosphoglycerate mutase family protein [Alphaproteobacteria bacterium]|nr:phosphoglycerate mutase family protein [Alphaproteobacteria bacterium]